MIMIKYTLNQYLDQELKMKSQKYHNQDIFNESLVTNRGSCNPNKSPSSCFLNCSLSSIHNQSHRLSTPNQSLKIDNFLFQSTGSNQSNYHTINKVPQYTVRVNHFEVGEESQTKVIRQSEKNVRLQRQVKSSSLLDISLKKRDFDPFKKEQPLLRPLSFTLHTIRELNSQITDSDTDIQSRRRTSNVSSTDISSS